MRVLCQPVITGFNTGRTIAIPQPNLSLLNADVYCLRFS
jgi:hypothetical protein